MVNVDNAVSKASVNKLRDRLIEGMQIATPIGKAKLLKKYPYIAHTDKGCWQWVEVYLAEHGYRCVDRQKLVVKADENRTN